MERKELPALDAQKNLRMERLTFLNTFNGSFKTSLREKLSVLESIAKRPMNDFLFFSTKVQVLKSPPLELVAKTKFYLDTFLPALVDNPSVKRVDAPVRVVKKLDSINLFVNFLLGATDEDLNSSRYRPSFCTARKVMPRKKIATNS